MKRFSTRLHNTLLPAFAIAFLTLTGTLSAQNLKLWIGAGAGGSGLDFNTVSNWNPATPLSSTDSCVMILNDNATITLSADATIHDLYCAISGAGKIFRLDAADKTLKMLGTLYGEATSGNSSTQMQFSVGTGAGSAGKIQVNGSASIGIGGAQFTYTRGVTGSNSSFVFRGDVTYGTHGSTSGTNFPGSYIFDAPGTQTFTVNSAVVGLSSVQIGDANTPTVVLAGTSSAYLNSSATNADLTISPDCQVDFGTSNTLNRNSTGGSFSLGAGATMKLGAGVGGQTGSNFPLNYSSISLNATSVVEYNSPGGVNQTVYAGSQYGFLTISKVSGSAGSTKSAGGTLTINQDLKTDTGATFNCSTFAGTVKGNIISNGKDTASTGKIILQSGSLQHAITGTGTFCNLELNDALGAALTTNATINGSLTLTNGTFAVGSDTLTLNGQVDATNGSLTSGVDGSVNYNQGAAGQHVLATNYGNLRFSNSNKILAFNGTIGIAGTFTPGTATGHTIAGSTVNFNGADSQVIPAFKYNNLTSSNAGARVLASSGTIGVFSSFTPGSNSYTIAGSKVEYNGNVPQTLPSGFPTYYSLVCSNDLLVTGIPGLTVSSLLEVKKGTFNSSGVFDTVQIDAAGTLTTSPGESLTVSGNWINNGTFTSNTTTVVFNGSNPQTISGAAANTTFDNLKINNSSGLQLSMNANCTVNGTLSLLTVNVNVGSNTLTIGTTGSVNQTSGYVIGNLKKTFSGLGSKMFEVGTANGFSPVTVNVTSGTGSFTVKAVQNVHPKAIGANALHRYWTLTNGGIVQADLTFSYLAGDVVGNEAAYVIGNYHGSWSVVGGSVNTSLHQATKTGVTSFSDWTLGESSSLLSLSVADVAIEEGDIGTVNADFTVNLTGTSVQTVTVNYSTQDSTALVSDNDYIATSGLLTIPAGSSSGVVHVSVKGDHKREADEFFLLKLSGSTNAAVADTSGAPDSSGVGTILNDDPIPSITISDTSGSEGMTGTSLFVFALRLSNPSADTISFNYKTLDSTATDTSAIPVNNDYQRDSGVVKIPPGVTSANISVNVNGDSLVESDEAFLVRLSNAVNCSIDDNSATGLIVNDDGTNLSIGNVVGFEGKTSRRKFDFTLHLTNPVDLPVTVKYSTDSSEGSATSDVDFIRTFGTATILPGETSGIISVDVIGDSTDEPDETFNVFIWDATNTVITVNTGTGTILNDDLKISISDVQRPEGNSGTTSFPFYVRLDTTSTHLVTVNYSTVPGSATGGGVDYATTSGTLTFSPGKRLDSIMVPVVGDAIDERFENFFVNLSGQENAIITDSQAVGTIQNDDASLSVNDVSVTERDTGQSNATFTIRLSNAAFVPVRVTYYTADGTASTADSDYIAPKRDSVTFAIGDTTKTVTVKVKGDIKFEPPETFFLNLTRPTGMPIADSQGVGTILNDDARICINEYYDENHNGQIDPGEQPMGNTLFKLISTTTHDTLKKTSDANGQVCFDNIPLDSYLLTEVVDKIYTIGVPASGNYVYNLYPAEDTTSTWLNTAAAAAKAFRTVKYETWGNEVNSEGKRKSVRRAPDKVQAKFYLVSPQPATAMTIQFNMPFTGKVYSDSLRTSVLDSLVKTDFKAITTPIPIAHVYLIEGYGSKGKPLGATVSWKVSSTVSIKQSIFDQSQFLVRELRLPMPNLHNVGEELFSGTPSAFPEGFLLGVPRGTKKANSVLHMKYADVLKSLQFKGALHDATLLHCLDKFDAKAKPISKQQRSLPPNKQNNRLFAELLTLKLNIAASDVGLFPSGLGDLIYRDSLDITNPLNGLTINEIASVGDTLVSCLTTTTLVPPALDQLYSVLRKIDTTFAGPIDTLSFATKTRIKGVKLLDNVPFLIAMPGVAHPRHEFMSVADGPLPLSYRLEQNYPNPFNPTTTIQFELADPSFVTLKVYNMLGQEVTTLFNRVEMDAGTEEVDFEAGNLSSGVYFYRLEVGDIETGQRVYSETHKMVIMK